MASGEPATVPTGAIYALLFASAVLSGVGDVLIFKWAKERGAGWFAGGIAVWVISLVLMGYLFRYSTLPFSLVVVLLIVIHLVIDVVWDVGVMGHHLSAWQWVGVGLAAGALVFLQAGGKRTPTPGGVPQGVHKPESQD